MDVLLMCLNKTDVTHGKQRIQTGVSCRLFEFTHEPVIVIIVMTVARAFVEVTRRECFFLYWL